MRIASPCGEVDERSRAVRSGDDALAEAQSQRRKHLLPTAERQQLLRDAEHAEHLRRHHQPAGARGLRLCHHFIIESDDGLDHRQDHPQQSRRQQPVEDRRSDHSRERHRHLKLIARRRREDHQRLGSDGATDGQQLHLESRSQPVHPRSALRQRQRDELVPDDFLINEK